MAKSPALPVPAAGGGSSSDLVKTLLLSLTVLSLVLAMLPWRHVLYPHVGPGQALRVRVAFVMVSLSVGFGYVVAAYLNGSA